MTDAEITQLLKKLMKTRLLDLVQKQEGGPQSSKMGDAAKELKELEEALGREVTLEVLFELAGKDALVVYAGMTGRDPSEECFRWLTARGAHVPSRGANKDGNDHYDANYAEVEAVEAVSP